MAANPPPLPVLPGVARVTAASVPPARPPAPLPVLAPAAPGQPLSIPFADGRAILPEGASQALTALVRRPGVTRIVVAGYGDAADADPDIQAAALPLALARAQAIRTALRRIGIPDTSIQMTAEAVGHGGVARAE
jgi:outer membrane protein OmpA-like peptidoglycan-associated protein